MNEQMICPKCGKQIQENDNYYFCEDKESCGFKLFKKACNTNIDKENFIKLINHKETDLLKMKSKEGKDFMAKLKYNDDFSKTELIFGEKKEASIGKCPSCDSDIVMLKGPYGEYYKCKNCNFKINGIIAGRKISQKEVIELLNNNETSVLNGFLSKQGKSFSAKLILENNEIKFKFE